MPSTSERILSLRRLAPSLREPALVETLCAAGEEERPFLADELALLLRQRLRPGSPLAIAPALDVCPREQRRCLVLSILPALPGALREAARAAVPSETSAALSLTSAALGCAHESPAFSEALARAGVGPALDEALDCLARGFDEHRSEEALEAVIATCSAAGPRVRAWLEGDDEPGHMALRAAARTASRRAPISSAIVWLAHPALAGVARRALAGGAAANDRFDALRSAHLLRSPARRRALGLLGSDHLQTLCPIDACEQPDDARLNVMTSALSLRLSDKHLSGLSSASLQDPSAPVRLRAVLALERAQTARMTDEIASDFSFDSDERVARLAAGVLADARTVSRRLHNGASLSALSRSPHASVRRIARVSAPSSNAWGTDVPCPIAARLELDSDPEGFTLELRSRLASPDDVPQTVALLTLADRLGLAGAIEDELLRLIGSAQREVASKCAPLLGRLESEASGAALVAALGADDDRVRANALEAIAVRRPHLADCAAYADDANPRVRANAIRSLVARDPGGSEPKEALGAMLRDRRPHHRRSAIWIAGRTRSLGSRTDVAELAASDPEPEVRTRAESCARALDAWRRLSWTRPRDTRLEAA